MKQSLQGLGTVIRVPDRCGQADQKKRASTHLRKKLSSSSRYCTSPYQKSCIHYLGYVIGSYQVRRHQPGGTFGPIPTHHYAVLGDDKNKPDDNSQTELDYDCEAFLRELEKMHPFKTIAYEDDDEFLELQSVDCSTDSTTFHSNSSNSLPFNAIHNVIATIAAQLKPSSLMWSTNTAKLLSNYAQTLPGLLPNESRRRWKHLPSSIEPTNGKKKSSVISSRGSQEPTWNRSMRRINETVSTDTAFMDKKGKADGIAGHGGSIGFQLFVGNTMRHLAAYPVQTDSDYPTVLGNYIRTHGAPKKVFSDNAKAELSAKAKAIYRNFGIADTSSEPHYQNQNAAEREIGDVKKDIEHVLNITNTPYKMWPLCAEYICLVKNNTARTVGRRLPFPSGYLDDSDLEGSVEWPEMTPVTDAVTQSVTVTPN
jgi:hypothetical protein